MKRVNSIQHIGVAVQNIDESLKFYRKIFGMNIPFFDSIQAAPLMDVYTRNETITKRASMVMNLQGGCAMEVIRPTSFEPKKANFQIQVGDIHIFQVHYKAQNVENMHRHCKVNNAPNVSEIKTNPAKEKVFDLQDLDGNFFRVETTSEMYKSMGHPSNGVAGCSIGVSNIEASMNLYAKILGYDKVEFDVSGVFNDYAHLPGGLGQFRRVRLTQSAPTGGGFAKVIGNTFIELVQCLDRTPARIFKGRIWGDSGFVHLGLDVKKMEELGKDLELAGFGFRCDSSNELNMGKTRVHCTYIDDPDGTLIECIEVYKVPIVEKWGVFLNVEKRNPLKPLPDFMLKALRFSRIKD
jgi:catechol 2,3-dioxygenase-like lactoylglutathione lyase family enzyme